MAAIIKDFLKYKTFQRKTEFPHKLKILCFNGEQMHSTTVSAAEILYLKNI